MRLDIETIVVLQIVMTALSNGVDPTSNIPFPEDTILNSLVLKHCFADSAEIFKYLRENIDEINSLSARKVTNQKLPFYLREAEYKKIPVSNEPVSISKFVYSINEICTRTDMKKLRATQITHWLTAQGYLELIDYGDDGECKVATECGREIGIMSVEKINSRGTKYITNLYDIKAQKFIVDYALPEVAHIVTL